MSNDDPCPSIIMQQEIRMNSRVSALRNESLCVSIVGRRLQAVALKKYEMSMSRFLPRDAINYFDLNAWRLQGNTSPGSGRVTNVFQAMYDHTGTQDVEEGFRDALCLHYTSTTSDVARRPGLLLFSEKAHGQIA